MRRLARWLNREICRQNIHPAKYIALMGARLLGASEDLGSIKVFGFGQEGEMAFLWQVNGRFLKHEEGSSLQKVVAPTSAKLVDRANAEP